MSTRTWEGHTIDINSDVDVHQSSYRRYNRCELPRYTTENRNSLTEIMFGEQIYNITTNTVDIYTPTGWRSLLFSD